MTSAAPKFGFVNTGPVAGGRIEIYSEPELHRHYALGVDCALGLDSGDFDAGVVLRDDGEQVAEFEGHWGDTLPQVVESLLDWFDPFIVAEFTKESAAILRHWYDAGRWLYHHRAEQKKGRTVRDQLGHVPGPSDITIHWLRRDLRERDYPIEPTAAAVKNWKPGDAPLPKPPYRTARHRIIIRSEATHGQLCKFRFIPRRSGQAIEDARDKQLVWGSPSGEHDDLVRALAYANAGLEWLPQFERPKPKLPKDSYGHLIGMDDDEEAKSKWE